MHSKWLDFFSFKFWVGRVGGGFFFICSQHVPQVLNGSPSSAQWVPNVPNVFPKDVPNSTLLLIPYVLPRVLTYIGTPKGTSSFKRIFYLGGPSVIKFFFSMGQSK
jgi:hypothetical protein